MLERVVLESLGLGAVALQAFALTQFLKIAVLDRSHTDVWNQAAFIIIPTITYLIYRFYFGILLIISNKFEKYPVLSYILWYILAFVGIGAIFFSSRFQVVVEKSLEIWLGDLPLLLWKIAKPQVEKSYTLFLRYCGLLLGLMVPIIVVENLVRLLAFLLSSLLRVFLTTTKL